MAGDRVADELIEVLGMLAELSVQAAGMVDKFVTGGEDGKKDGENGENDEVDLGKMHGDRDDVRADGRRINGGRVDARRIDDRR